MEVSVILNIIFGGGLIGLTVAIVTLRSTVRKARAEATIAEAKAEQACAEAEKLRIDNADHATRILIENIVKPLENALNEARKDLQATKREMARLRRVLGAAGRCPHADSCIVLAMLRDDKAEPGGYQAVIAGGRTRGSDNRNKGDP